MPFGEWLNQLLVDLGEPLRNLLADNDYFSRGGSSFSTQDQYASGWFVNPRQMMDVLGHNDIDHAELYLGRLFRGLKSEVLPSRSVWLPRPSSSSRIKRPIRAQEKP